MEKNIGTEGDKSLDIFDFNEEDVSETYVIGETERIEENGENEENDENDRNEESGDKY